MEILAIANQKGGCGKTTTATNLSAALALNGKKILLVDLDPQAHASLGLGVEKEIGIYDCLSKISKNRCSLEKIIVSISAGFDLAPSNIMLSTLDQELADEIGRESRLFDILKELGGQYDFCLIDCPPNLGLLTVNAIRAANSLVIPVEASRFSVDGVNRLVDIIQLVRERLNHPVDFRILVNNFDSRLRHSFNILNKIKDTFGAKVYNTIVHINVKLKEAQSVGETIFSFDKYSRGAKDYYSLSREIISKEESFAGILAEKMKKVVKDKTKEFIPVTFKLDRESVSDVFVVGDFNNWTPDETSRMVKKNGAWTRKMNLKPGSYKYRYVIDGQWSPDPDNPASETNPFGEKDSLLNIGTTS